MILQTITAGEIRLDNEETYKDIPISQLKLPGRIYNKLMRVGYSTLYLLIVNYDNLFQRRIFGEKSFREIDGVLSKLSAEQRKVYAVPREKAVKEGRNNDSLLKLYSNIGADAALIKKLEDQYGFKTEWLDLWDTLIDKNEGQVSIQKANKPWLGQLLLVEERKVIDEMISQKAFYYRKNDKRYYLLNNRRGDCAYFIVSHEGIRCFFLADLPEVLREMVKDARLNFLTEEECENRDALGHFDMLSEKPYALPGDIGIYKHLADHRDLVESNYAKTLYGSQYCRSEFSEKNENKNAEVQAKITEKPQTDDLQAEKRLEKKEVDSQEEQLDETSSIEASAKDIKEPNRAEQQTTSLKGTKLTALREKQEKPLKPQRKKVKMSMEELLNAQEEDMKIRPFKNDAKALERIYASYPLLGSCLLKEETLQAIYQKSRDYVGRLLNNADYKPSLKLEMYITLAVINYAKGWDTDNESAFWKYIAAQFGYRDERNRLRELLCSCLKDALQRNDRWFITSNDENLYKASVVVHAMTPKRSWIYFCDFLFDFYKTNLDWTYAEDDPMVIRMVLAIRNKFEDSEDLLDRELEISSKVFYFRESIIKLILNRPKYAAFLASKLIGRIDNLLNHTAKPPKTYEEKLCDEWMENKLLGITAERRKEKTGERRSIAFDYTRINPAYRLYDEQEPRIVFPDVRLSQNDFSSLKLSIYCGNECVEQRTLGYYGNELGKTMKGFELKLGDCLRRSSSKEIDPRIVLFCDEEIIYDSKSTLYRKELIFKNAAEINAENLELGGYTIFVPSNISVEFVDAEVTEIESGSSLKGYYAELQRNFMISIAGELTAFDHAHETGTIRIVIPENKYRADYCVSGIRYNVLNRQDVIRIIILGDDLKRFRLLINAELLDIESLPCERSGDSRVYKLSMNTLQSDEIIFRIVDLGNERQSYSRNFKILDDFYYRFNKACYYSPEDYTDANISLAVNDEKQRVLTVPRNGDLVCIPFQLGELEIPIPVIKVFDQKNIAWDTDKIYWIKDIPQECFLYVKIQNGLTAQLFLDDRPVGTEQKETFALGNALYGYSSANIPARLKLSMKISQNDKTLANYKIGKIALREQFVQRPVLKLSQGKLSWNLGYGFIGNKDGNFKLTICMSTEYETEFELKLDQEEIVSGLKIPLGEYRYKIEKESGNLFSQQMTELVSGNFFAGDVNEIRFSKSIIRITAITLEEEEQYKVVPIRPSYIDHIEYQGIRYIGSEDRECPVYVGTMYYRIGSGGRCEYSYADQKDKAGNQLYQINPVRIVFINDSTLSITHETGDPEEPGDGLYYYRYYDRKRMENIYMITDREPTRNNEDKYYLADLYTYTKEGV